MRKSSTIDLGKDMSFKQGTVSKNGPYEDLRVDTTMGTVQEASNEEGTGTTSKIGNNSNSSMLLKANASFRKTNTMKPMLSASAHSSQSTE